MTPPDFPLPDPGLQALVETYAADVASIERRYPLGLSSVRLDRLDRLTDEYRERLEALPLDALSPAARIDHALLRNRLVRARRETRRLREEVLRVAPALPFLEAIEALDEARAAMRPLDPAEAAGALDGLGKTMAATAPPSDARAARTLGELREAMERWRAFHLGYDPTLDWWVREPLARVMDEFERLSQTPSEDDAIPGRCIGREALLEDLADEMLPYSPEELIAIGEREYAWCLDEMRKASRELGHGDDWRAALKAVKDTCVAPGEQTRVVRGLALEAIAYVESLVTVPDLAKETWRMAMMTPGAQKVNPFFLAGSPSSSPIRPTP